jgi:hypothetical protein
MNCNLICFLWCADTIKYTLVTWTHPTGLFDIDCFFCIFWEYFIFELQPRGTVIIVFVVVAAASASWYGSLAVHVADKLTSNATHANGNYRTTCRMASRQQCHQCREVEPCASVSFQLIKASIKEFWKWSDSSRLLEPEYHCYTIHRIKGGGLITCCLLPLGWF